MAYVSTYRIIHSVQPDITLTRRKETRITRGTCSMIAQPVASTDKLNIRVELYTLQYRSRNTRGKSHGESQSHWIENDRAFNCGI